MAPTIGDLYERNEFPYDIVRQMGEMGLFGLPFPEEYGGMGGDYFALCIALEELARVDSSVAITLEAGVSLGAMPIFRFGTEEQKQEWLPRLTPGSMLGAFGLTEPGARLRRGRYDDHGAALRRRQRVGHQRHQGVHHQLGHRHHRTGHGHRGHGDADAGKKQISSIIVPSGTPGFTVSKKYSKVGWNASDTRELSFADCRVPAANLLGERGRGYAQFLSILDEGRIAIAALGRRAGAGLRRRVGEVREAAARVRPADRAQPGDPFKVADMEMRAHTARLAYYDAAARMLRGEPFKKQAAIAKLYSSEIAVTNAREATQIHGGYGFMNEFPVARMWRDSKILEIGEGTSEVQRMLIARELGL